MKCLLDKPTLLSSWGFNAEDFCEPLTTCDQSIRHNYSEVPLQASGQPTRYVHTSHDMHRVVVTQGVRVSKASTVICVGGRGFIIESGLNCSIDKIK